MHRFIQTLALLALVTVNVNCSQPNHNIEPRADAALHRMSDSLAKAQSFKVHSSATMEQRLETGQLAQFDRDTTLVFRRPDRLQADVSSGANSLRIWHQGTDLTVLDPIENKYASITTPREVGAMFDFLADKHNIVVPLSDLLYPNPYAVLTERVDSGTFVGQEQIAGQMCDHLLFTQGNVNWQIWIDTGQSAEPRKVVITYKNEPGMPQYEAVMDQWQFNLPKDDSVFVAHTPPSATRVELNALVGQEEGSEQ